MAAYRRTRQVVVAWGMLSVRRVWSIALHHRGHGHVMFGKVAPGWRHPDEISTRREVGKTGLNEKIICL
jgi:hypothetical protein